MRKENVQGLPGLTASSKTIRAPRKRKNPGATTKKLSKDAQQDLEIKKLKKLIKKAEPPTKSSYIEVVKSPENSWDLIGAPWPAKGGAMNERLGQDIAFKSLNIRYTVNVADSDGFDTFRVLIVQWNEENEFGQPPVNHLSMLFEEALTDYPTLAPFNTQSAAKYRILYDKVHNLCDSGIAQATENVLILPSQLAVTKFTYQTDGGGQLPQLDSGIILMYIASDSTTEPNPRIDTVWKFNWTDT